jgi:hypothetical protein
MSSHDDTPLFAGYEPPPVEPVEQLSADRRRTERQAANVAAGIHPLTRGPLHPLASRHRDSSSPKSDPFTCGSCWFRTVVGYHKRSYAKCLFDPRRGADDPLDLYARVSHSAASDVRAWWPACPDYSPSGRLSRDAARSIPTNNDDESEAR